MTPRRPLNRPHSGRKKKEIYTVINLKGEGKTENGRETNERRRRDEVRFSFASSNLGSNTNYSWAAAIVKYWYRGIVLEGWRSSYRFNLSFSSSSIQLLYPVKANNAHFPRLSRGDYSRCLPSKTAIRAKHL